MKSSIFLLLFALNYFLTFGQQIEFSTGYCINNFYDLCKDEHHFRTQYKQGSGYGININLSDVLIHSYLLRFSIKFSKYHGSIMTSDGGLAGTNTTIAQVAKCILGLGIYPINIDILKKIKFSFGGEFNYLIASDVMGTKSSSFIGTGFKVVDLEDGSIDILNEFNVGIVSRVGYNIHVYNQWYLLPEYNLYLGLTNEFHNIESNVKSFRHYFMIGAGYRFK